MPSRDQVLEKIVKLVIFDPGASWSVIYEDSIAKHQITKKEVEEEVRKRLGGDQPPCAAVPKHPLPSEGSGSISMPCPENSEDEIK